MLSEEYRLAAREWVQLDAAARMLEETKSAILSQMMSKQGDVPAAHAERDSKASPEWMDHIQAMVNARTRANEAKVKLEWVRMRFQEQMSIEANARAESRL